MNRRHFLEASIGAAASVAVGASDGVAAGSEFQEYDAVGLAGLVRRGEVRPEELLEAAIARCEEINPVVNAVVVKHYDEARAAVTAGLPDGPLRGVPFLVKDNDIELAGTATTNGGPLFTIRAQADSEIVTRYKRAGLVIFGKAAAPETGMAGSTESTLHGLTRNPWDLEKSAGGSSGGSCVAVAAGIVPAAHASDGGGSVRAPASQCGVFGLKPTRGLTPHSSRLGVKHAVTRTVRDSAALLDAVAGPEPGALYRACAPVRGFLSSLERPLRPVKIAMFTAYDGFDVNPDCVDATHHAAELCEQLGHSVEEVEPPVDLTALEKAFLTMFKVATRALIQQTEYRLGRPLERNEIELSKWLAADAAKDIDASAYLLADMSVARTTAQMAAFFRSYDVLLSPTIGRPPVDPARISPLTGPVDAITKVVETFGAYTVLGSIAGIPGMSVPLYWTAAGLPVGTLFQSAMEDDALLLQLAAQLEVAQPWIHRYPSLP